MAACHRQGEEKMMGRIGKYEILDKLGEGGNGTVYAVLHPNTGAYLAMKEFADAGAGEREAKILLGLSHPGIPKCHDCFIQDEKYYLLMDYFEGENLWEYKEERGGGDEERILHSLAGLISYLHSLPVPLIHGDLKPENIMITKEGEVCLLDFGSAFYPHHPPRKIMGSPGYSAPELKLGRCGTESDVYAFGKLMIYLLTGRDPLFFDEEPDAGVFLRMGMSGKYAEIATRCLCSDPLGRFHSLKEVCSAMEKKRRFKPALSGFGVHFGGICAFLGLWLYFMADWAKGKYLILAGCILLIGEMWITGSRRGVTEGEFTEEYRLFLSEDKSQ